jgi:type II secretory ATPase GspE/PulE/Tfp pilus assembly ATPase PilB-like protein
MINEAFDRRASDIHIEPDTIDQHVAVRFRIDGECIPYKIYPYEFRAAITSRIKIMSNLDITERRLPQDGKIRFKRPNADEIELRVATVPTHGYVEDVVMRILTRGHIMTLEELNMYPQTYEDVLKILKNPYGLFLIVGPTGSGKTTTAHAALHVLNTPNTKIWTVEDPVEITQQGIRQVQAHHKIGFDFSHAMRAFLRSDPDIILVGEMRDYETAKMGVEASTTGHLVLSTLHTNNAPETIVRLLDMGIDPFAFADSLLCVLAQRLTRKLCPHCKERYHPSRTEFEEIVRSYGEKLITETKTSYNSDMILYRARGCRECTHTGFRGMMGIFELLIVSENIKQMIINKKSIPAIRKTATAEGMRTLLQDGISKVLAGETELKEVLSVCMR